MEHLSGCGADAAVDYRINDMVGEVVALGVLAPEFGLRHGQVLSEAGRRWVAAIAEHGPAEQRSLHQQILAAAAERPASAAPDADTQTLVASTIAAAPPNREPPT